LNTDTFFLIVSLTADQPSTFSTRKIRCICSTDIVPVSYSTYLCLHRRCGRRCPERFTPFLSATHTTASGFLLSLIPFFLHCSFVGFAENLGEYFTRFSYSPESEGKQCDSKENFGAGRLCTHIFLLPSLRLGHEGLPLAIMHKINEVLNRRSNHQKS
jgi:hypothetical protein